ncbi:hypothetical protein EDC35_108165 [Thiobaca trueperi]|uniref:Uncharacterized protein n=1 Tax=Thiobaca trueperi TaxID=127458 RepID=A0A4R3MT28_9GAMM|nr:hypothetical protein EDC35_108165 [Thiobaca trueperi]
MTIDDSYFQFATYYGIFKSNASDCPKKEDLYRQYDYSYYVTYPPEKPVNFDKYESPCASIRLIYDDLDPNIRFRLSHRPPGSCSQRRGAD